MPANPPLSLETVGPDEAAQIERIVALQRQLHDKSDSPVHRAQHPKHLGLAKGEFEVEPGLPDDLRHGLFAEGRSHPAWVRFSNGRGQDDARATVRGLALKVTGLDHLGRPDQDFLLIDHPVFFIKDLPEYVALFEGLVAAEGGFPRRFVFPDLNPFHWRIAAIRRIKASQKKRGSLLTIPYWSTTPYRLGPRAIKFMLQPHESNGADPVPGDTPDFLCERLAAHLESKPAAFDFLVQLQIDPVAMPVEDPTVNWDDARPASPWRKVATLRLPLQSPTSPERMKLAEDMAFTPWHSLPDHAPLGGVNRARRAVYETLSRDRLAANGRNAPAMPNGTP
jgi:Catalase